MSTRYFRWAIIFLLVGVVLAIGLLGFHIWNRQVDDEGLVADWRASQPGKASRAHSPSRGEPFAGEEESQVKTKSEHAEPAAGEEESQENPKSKRAGPVAGEGASQKKPESKHAEPSAREGASQKKPKSESAEGTKTYQVDTDASRIYVKVGSATRIGHPHGVEGNLKSGKIELGAGGELVFDMSSFKADTKEARQKVGLEGKSLSENEAKKVGEKMLSAEVLDVEKFPVATYKIIIIKPTERQDAGVPGAYEANGQFLLHGAERPVQFKAKLERVAKQDAVKLSGSFAIKQSDYGITPYSAVGGLVKVADQLEIFGDLVLSPAK